MSTFVEIPSATMLTELRTIGEAITKRGGKAEQGRMGNEITFDFTHHNGFACVRVLTSLGVGSVTARDVGRDAVRITVGAYLDGKFRLIKKFRRIHRTAPKGNQEARVSAFLERFKQALRDAYAIAGKTPTCPDCSSPMAARENKQSGSEFYGCMKYPECRGTRPMEGGTQ